MSTEAMAFINDLMQGMGIPYAFYQWNTQPPDDYYFVGEYSEIETPEKVECGLQESTFYLRGFTRKSILLLQRAKETIERNISKTAILGNGSGIAVSYDSALIVPTGDAELKSIKINLNIKEWKVN